MIEVIRIESNQLVYTDALSSADNWVRLIAPSDAELDRASREGGFDIGFLRAALDEEERPRIESAPGQILILVDIPSEISDATSPSFETVPLGIIVTRHNVATVCLRESPVYKNLMAKVHDLSVAKRTRFVLQLLYHVAMLYLFYLRRIDRQTDHVENQLRLSTKNEHLFRLMALQKSLVYFTTSLKANQVILDKLLRSQLRKGPATSANGSDDATLAETAQVLRMYPEDEDLLEDVVTENKQAIEMADVYSSILAGLMDAFASVISNNLNIVMKFLTSVTLILAIPTMVFSFYGMNVDLPGEVLPHAWIVAVAVSVVISSVGVYLLRKRDMF